MLGAPPDGRSVGSSHRDWASRGLFTGVAMVTGLVRKHVNSRRDNSPAQSRTVAYSTHFNFLIIIILFIFTEFVFYY